MSYARKGPELIPVHNRALAQRTSLVSTFSPGGRPAVGREAKDLPPIKASKNARELAKKRGIDLRKLSGTGIDGAITVEDVRKASGGV